MSKTFKEGQQIIATLPNGRVVDGVYIEPYGDDGHSIYVNEYNGTRGDKPLYKKIRYGVKDNSIIARPKNIGKTSDKQYEAWEERANILQERIDADTNSIETIIEITNNSNNSVVNKLKRKIDRSKTKLNIIKEKMEEFKKNETLCHQKQK